MYKLMKDPFTGAAINMVNLLPSTFIPFDPANIDYQQFKTEVNADEAQLENADGQLMTAEEAKAFVATLP